MNIVCDHSCVERQRSNDPGVCPQALVHFVTSPASLIADQTVWTHPIRVNFPNTSEKTESTLFDIFSKRYQFLLFKPMVVWAWSRDFVQLLSPFLFASSEFLSTRFFAWRPMSQDHATVFAWGFSHPGKFLFAAEEIRESIIYCARHKLVSFCMQPSQEYMAKKCRRFSKINQFHRFARGIVPQIGQTKEKLLVSNFNEPTRKKSMCSVELLWKCIK